MTFNILGEYCFIIPITTMFLNTNIKVTHTNLITTNGEYFFINRCINDIYNPIQYIVIGNGVNSPQKSDIQLGNETKRNTCIQEVDEDNKRALLTTSFSSEDIIGATEIGVVTTQLNGEEILISHDVFEDEVLKENYLYGVTGSISLEYSFYFSTSQIKSGWTKQSNNNVYWIFEPNEVIKVYDVTTNYGLRKVNSIEQVQDIKNSYFHDLHKTNNLYIHLYHEDIENGRRVYAPNPNTHTILVENK